MSDTFWFGFWTAFAPTVVALCGLVVSLVNSSKANVIHTLVNSQSTALRADLAIALARIEHLEQFIANAHGAAVEP